MTLKRDYFDFIYELMVDYFVDHVDYLTEYEKDTLTHIRHDFKKIHDMIIDR